MNVAEVLTIAEQSKSLPVHPDPRFPPSLYYRFLRAMAAHTDTDDNWCVELGVCGGGGCLHMCIGTYGVVIGVEIGNEYPGNIAYIQEHFDNFHLWEMDSVEAASYAWHIWTGGDAAPGDIPRVRLLFIDTVHTYEQTMAEYNAWKRWLVPGAIVCLDDLYRPGMDRAWAEMPEPKVRIDWLHLGGAPTDGGFGVVIYEGRR